MHIVDNKLSSGLGPIRETIYGVFFSLTADDYADNFDFVNGFSLMFKFVVVSLIEAFQLATLMLSSRNIFHCNSSPGECVGHIIFFPLSFLGYLSSTLNIIAVILLGFIMVFGVILTVLIAISLKKREYHAVIPKRLMGIYIEFFMIVYFADLARLALSQWACAVVAGINVQNEDVVCQSQRILGLAIPSTFFLLPLLLFGVIASLIFRKLELTVKPYPGQQAHGRVAAMILVAKIAHVGCWIGTHVIESMVREKISEEQNLGIDHSESMTILNACRIVLQVLSLLTCTFMAIMQIISPPYTRDIDNRLAAGLRTGLFLVSVVGVMDATVSVSDNTSSSSSSSSEDASMLRIPYVILLFVGGFVIGWSSAMIRVISLRAAVQRDLTLLTENFDSTYSSALDLLIAEEIDPYAAPANALQANANNDNNVNPHTSSPTVKGMSFRTATSLAPPFSPTRSMIKGKQLTAYNSSSRFPSPTPPFSGSVPQSPPNGLANSEATPVPHVSRLIMQQQQNAHSSNQNSNATSGWAAEKNKTEQIASRTAATVVATKARMIMQSSGGGGGGVADSNGALMNLSSGGADYRENKNPKVAEMGRGGVNADRREDLKVTMAMIRMAAYKEGESFGNIRRALILSTDCELLSRLFVNEWTALSEHQRQIRHAAISQIFLSLFQQQSGVSALAYLWFGLISKTFFYKNVPSSAAPNAALLLKPSAMMNIIADSNNDRHHHTNIDRKMPFGMKGNSATAPDQAEVDVSRHSSAVRYVKIAIEMTKAFDVIFLCFRLIMEAERAENEKNLHHLLGRQIFAAGDNQQGGAAGIDSGKGIKKMTKTKRATALADMALYRKLLEKVKVEHQIAVRMLKRYFRETCHKMSMARAIMINGHNAAAIHNHYVDSSPTKNGLNSSPTLEQQNTSESIQSAAIPTSKSRFFSISNLMGRTPRQSKIINSNSHERPSMMRRSTITGDGGTLSQGNNDSSANDESDSIRRTTLVKAMNALMTCEQILKEMTSKFPNSKEVSRRSMAFKLQFFREEALADTARSLESSLADGASESSAGGGNNNQSAAVLSVSATSIESQKVIKIGKAMTDISTTFKYLKIGSHFGMTVIICFMFGACWINIGQMTDVMNSLRTFEYSDDLFIILPSLCYTMRKTLTAADYFYYTYGKNAVTAITDLATLLQNEQAANAVPSVIVDAGVTASNLTSYCTDLLTDYADVRACNIIYREYSDLIIRMEKNNITNAIQSGTPVPGEDYASSSGAIGTSDSAWWDVWVETSNAVDVMGNTYTGFVLSDDYSTSEKRLTSAPVVYENAVRAVILLEGFGVDDVDTRLILGTKIEIPKMVDLQLAAVRRLADAANELNDNNVLTLIRNPINEIYYFSSTVDSTGDVSYSQYSRFVSLEEAMASFSNSADEIITLLQADWNAATTAYHPSTLQFLNMCVGSPISDMDDILNATVSTVSSTITRASWIVVACGLAAAICALIFSILTVSLVRRKLKEFDRRDGKSTLMHTADQISHRDNKAFLRAVRDMEVNIGSFDPQQAAKERRQKKEKEKQRRMRRDAVLKQLGPVQDEVRGGRVTDNALTPANYMMSPKQLSSVGDDDNMMVNLLQSPTLSSLRENDDEDNFAGGDSQMFNYEHSDINQPNYNAKRNVQNSNLNLTKDIIMSTTPNRTRRGAFIAPKDFLMLGPSSVVASGNNSPLHSYLPLNANHQIPNSNSNNLIYQSLPYTDKNSPTIPLNILNVSQYNVNNNFDTNKNNNITLGVDQPRRSNAFSTSIPAEPTSLSSVNFQMNSPNATMVLPPPIMSAAIRQGSENAFALPSSNLIRQSSPNLNVLLETRNRLLQQQYNNNNSSNMDTTNQNFNSNESAVIPYSSTNSPVIPAVYHDPPSTLNRNVIPIGSIKGTRAATAAAMATELATMAISVTAPPLEPSLYTAGIIMSDDGCFSPLEMTEYTDDPSHFFKVSRNTITSYPVESSIRLQPKNEENLIQERDNNSSSNYFVESADISVISSESDVDSNRFNHYPHFNQIEKVIIPSAIIDRGSARPASVYDPQLSSIVSLPPLGQDESEDKQPVPLSRLDLCSPASKRTKIESQFDAYTSMLVNDQDDSNEDKPFFVSVLKIGGLAFDGQRTNVMFNTQMVNPPALQGVNDQSHVSRSKSLIDREQQGFTNIPSVKSKAEIEVNEAGRLELNATSQTSTEIILGSIIPSTYHPGEILQELNISHDNNDQNIERMEKKRNSSSNEHSLLNPSLDPLGMPELQSMGSIEHVMQILSNAVDTSDNIYGDIPVLTSINSADEEYRKFHQNDQNNFNTSSSSSMSVSLQDNENQLKSNILVPQSPHKNTNVTLTGSPGQITSPFKRDGTKNKKKDNVSSSSSSDSSSESDMKKKKEPFDVRKSERLSSPVAIRDVEVHEYTLTSTGIFDRTNESPFANTSHSINFKKENGKCKCSCCHGFTCRSLMSLSFWKHQAVAFYKILRGRILLVFLSMWTLLLAFVIVALVIGVSAVRSFLESQESLVELSRTLFQAGQAAIRAPDAAAYYALSSQSASLPSNTTVISSMDWRQETLSEARDAFKVAVDAAESLFKNVVERQSSSSELTVGMSYPDRATLLFQPSCLAAASDWFESSALQEINSLTTIDDLEYQRAEVLGVGTELMWQLTNVNVTGYIDSSSGETVVSCGGRWNFYGDTATLERGLWRASLKLFEKQNRVYNSDLANEYLLVDQLDGSYAFLLLTVPDKSDSWWSVEAMRYDIGPGFNRLRLTFLQEASELLSSRKEEQWLVLGVGGALALFFIILVEFWLSRREMTDLKQTIIWLRLMPASLFMKRKLLEKGLGVGVEDDDEDDEMNRENIDDAMMLMEGQVDYGVDEENVK